jgi:8-amino-7-oxononanoate synthase
VPEPNRGASRGPRSGEIRERMAHELDELRAQSQYRTLQASAGIDLNSNDYLGLAHDARLQAAVAEALARSSAVGGTGSRLLSGNAREWQEAESDFAAFVGAESALYFGSGYAANVGLLSAILKPGDTVFSDALNHASLIDGMRLSGATKVIYAHGQLASLEAALGERARGPGAKVIVSETVFSMEGDVVPLDPLLRLAR